MKKSTRIAEMQKFHFGSKVVCSDGDAGSLRHVVFDTITCRLTYLGVKLGHLFGRMVDLPYDTVVDATGDGVKLGLRRAELAAARRKPVGGAVLDRLSIVERAGSGDKGTLRGAHTRTEGCRRRDCARLPRCTFRRQ
jgi:hypothetical protein